ncbi:hypothetical protein ACS0TY_009591 [Phlomoides rotata]
MDFQQELHTRNVYLVDELGDEDDVFYSELRKQVLQLTAEDEEEEVYENKNLSVVAEHKHGFNNGSYYDWAGNKEDFAAPVWMLNLWRPGNGTGVFIPQVVQQTKKKNKSRRKRNERGRRTYMRVEKV